MAVSSARENRLRSNVRMSAPMNVASAILTTSEASSDSVWLAMIVPSLLAKSRSRIVARIARSSQSRRRTAWSSGLGLMRQGREAGRQLGHDAAALLRGQSDPAADLGGRAPAADAKARACVEDAD